MPVSVCVIFPIPHGLSIKSMINSLLYLCSIVSIKFSNCMDVDLLDNFNWCFNILLSFLISLGWFCLVIHRYEFFVLIHRYQYLNDDFLNHIFQIKYLSLKNIFRKVSRRKFGVGRTDKFVKKVKIKNNPYPESG